MKNNSSCLLLITTLLILIAPSILFAAAIQLSWQPNAEPDLKGYNVYFGTQSRNYGPPIPLDRQTTFTLSGLEENISYYIAVSAVDNAGNESGFSEELEKSVSVPDTIAPTVNITHPAVPSGGVLETDTAVLVLSGTAQDDRNITQVAWSSGSASGEAVGTTNWSIPQVLLNEGRNSVIVTAMDDSGNTGSATLEVKYSAPDKAAPVVTITTPTRDDTFNTENSRIDLAGTAADEIGLSKITWRSSKGADGVASGTDNWSIADIPLTAGSNTITITASDLAGNSSSDSLTVVYSASDTKAPTVSIKDPTEKTRYLARKSIVSIGGVASDNIGITKVKWQNSRGEQGICSGTGNWQTPDIKLDRWWNTITITAYDKAGNSDQKQLRVFRWR